MAETRTINEAYAAIAAGLIATEPSLERLHIRIDEKDGAERYAIEPHDVEDFGEIIRLYGVDWSL